MFHKGYWQYLHISSIVEDLFSVPWKPCGLYRGGDLCRSHRAEDGRYVSFCSSQYVTFWRYVGFYFVDDMWVFSGIILFMIFEYGSIIKLDLICWSAQIMWILSQKQVCVRGDKIFTEKLFCAISPILSHSVNNIDLLFSSNDARTIWRIHIVKSI